MSEALKWVVALMQWLKLPARKVGDRGLEPHSGKSEITLAFKFQRTIYRADGKSSYRMFGTLLEPHSGKSEITLAFKFQRNKMFLPRSLVMIQYCREPPRPRGSVLGHRPPGLEFRILCLEGSVISFISPSSGGSLGPV